VSTSVGRPPLRVVSGSATPEEVAAIVAAVEACVTADAAAVVATQAPPDGESLQEWVRGARLGARRAGMQRGPWRLSGRITRRSHA
jgi:hypothetical protein